MSTNKEGIVEKFNVFIKKWTGNNYQHLIDTDGNDGERFREELRSLTEAHNKEMEKMLGDFYLEVLPLVDSRTYPLVDKCKERVAKKFNIEVK